MAGVEGQAGGGGLVSRASKASEEGLGLGGVIGEGCRESAGLGMSLVRPKRSRRGFGGGGGRGGYVLNVATIVLCLPQHALLFSPLYWCTSCSLPHQFGANIQS